MAYTLHDLRLRAASLLHRAASGLLPVSPTGVVAKPPREPQTGRIAQVPTMQGFGQRDVYGWNVDSAKAAISSMAGGAFGAAGLLADDFRLHPVIADALNVRWEGVNSLLPRHVSAACVVEHGEDCRRPKCRRARWVRDWFAEIEQDVYPDATLRNFHDDRLQMGQGIMGADWEERRDGRQRFWLPVLKPWHPSQTQYFYRGNDRSVDGGDFCATTINKGLLVVEPGMGRWVLSKAANRNPWIYGAVYSLGLDFIGDLFNFLTNQAFTERFGLGFTKYFADANFPHADQAGGPGQVPTSAQLIARVGSGAVIPLRMLDGKRLEEVELIHTSGSGWEAFSDTEKRILRRILLVYLGQDMTSVGQTGGFKQAVVHKETLWQKYGESASWFWDARRRTYRDPETGADRVVWEPCSGVLRSQLTRWITWFNFRDFELAPYVWRDATPPEDQAAREEQRSKRAQETASGIATLAAALPQLEKSLPGIPAAHWFVRAGFLDEAEAEVAQSGSPNGSQTDSGAQTVTDEEKSVETEAQGSDAGGEASQEATATTEFGAGDDD